MTPAVIQNIHNLKHTPKGQKPVFVEPLAFFAPEPPKPTRIRTAEEIRDNLNHVYVAFHPDEE